MKVIKKKKQRGSIILRIAVFAFAAFVAGSLLTQQVQIAEKRRQLEDLQQEIRLQEIKNGDLEQALGDGSDQGDYVERIARESLDYAKPNERVFVNIAGN